MRVLFIPLDGRISHTIPLIALDRMLDKAAFKTSLLLPRKKHQIAAKLGLNVLDIDYLGSDRHSFRTEMRAYSLFSPDVVIDDTNPTTGLATAFANLPRVTIQRTGYFPGSVPCDPRYRVSYDFNVKRLPDLTFMGIPQPQKLSDMFNANCKIVPGIPSIEQLPPSLRFDPTYFFSGPLLLDDYLVERAINPAIRPHGALPAEQDFTSLERFFAEHARRRRIYITFGTEAPVSAALLSCIRRLLRQRIAVVTSIEVEGISAEERQYYFYAPHLPMNFVCKNVDMMIHQCGSGTYHYPIMHRLPMMTIGTQTIDRDGVARRLEELGVSVHLGAPEERADFEEAFQDTVERYFVSDGAPLAEMRHRMAALNEEISGAAEAFNLEAVLQKAAQCAG